MDEDAIMRIHKRFRSAVEGMMGRGTCFHRIEVSYVWWVDQGAGTSWVRH